MINFTEKEIDFLSEAGIYASDFESEDLDVYNKAYNKLESFTMSNFHNGEPNEKALIGEGIFDKLTENDEQLNKILESETFKDYKKAIKKLNANSKEIKILVDNALKVTTQPAIQAAMETMINFSNRFSHLVVENYGPLLTNTILPEITKSIVGSEYLANIINTTSLAMQESIRNSVSADLVNIANVVNDSLLKSIPTFKLQVNEIISNCEEMQSIYLALNKLNFSKYVWPEIPSEEFVIDIIKTTDIDKSIRKFENGIDNDVIEKCFATDFIKNKKVLFDEIIDNYKRGNYYIAVLGITSLIDGFMSFMTNINTSKFTIRKNRILKSIKENRNIINEDGELFTLAMTSECMLNTFFAVKDFNTEEPDLINRHWIMHCQTSKDYTEYEFKKILFFLYGLIRLDELNN